MLQKDEVCRFAAERYAAQDQQFSKKNCDSIKSQLNSILKARTQPPNLTPNLLISEPKPPKNETHIKHQRSICLSRFPGQPPGRITSLSTSPFRYPGEAPDSCPGALQRLPGHPPGRCPPTSDQEKFEATQMQTLTNTPQSVKSTVPPASTGIPPPQGLVGRKLLWQNLSTVKIRGSIWEKLNTRGTTKLNLDLKNLTDLYFEIPTAQVPSDHQQLSAPRCCRPGSTDTSIVTVFDAKRRQNIEICLKGLGMTESLAAVIKTLTEFEPFDPNEVELKSAPLLTPESLQMIINMYPSCEEERDLRAAEKEVLDYSKKRLGKVEKFMLELLNIEQFKTRADSFLARRFIPAELSSTNAKLRQLLSCLSIVIESLENGALNAVFQLILEIGNYLNYGTKRGLAKGFTLETLSLLKTVKSVDNSTTLLRTLASIIQKDVHAKTLWTDLGLSIGRCHNSMSYSVEDMRMLTSQIASKLNQIEKTMVLLSHDENFQLAFKKFSEWAREEVQTVIEDIAKAENQLLKLVGLLAEKSKAPKDGLEIMKRLDRFWKDLNNANSINREKERKVQDQALRESRRRQLGNLTARPKTDGFEKKSTPREMPQTARPAYNHESYHVPQQGNSVSKPRGTCMCTEHCGSSVKKFITQSTSSTSAEVPSDISQLSPLRRSGDEKIQRKEETSSRRRFKSDVVAIQIPTLNLELVHSIGAPSCNLLSTSCSSSSGYQRTKHSQNWNEMPTKSIKFFQEHSLAAKELQAEKPEASMSKYYIQQSIVQRGPRLPKNPCYSVEISRPKFNDFNSHYAEDVSDKSIKVTKNSRNRQLSPTIKSTNFNQSKEQQSVGSATIFQRYGVNLD